MRAQRTGENGMDEIVRAVSGDGFVKISAVCATGAVERARQIHGTWPVATAALGRALCAASMMGNMMKEEGASLTIRINGGGPLGSVIAVADREGNVRGYVAEPRVDLPLRPDGKLDVGRVVGTDGMLTVSRDIGLKEPYIGSTRLVSGEVADDLAAYYAESEQVGAACGLGVLVDTDLSVKAAGGFIVQLMPGAPDEEAALLEANIAAMGPVTALLDAGKRGEDMARAVLAGLEPEILEVSTMEYRCYCSREKVAGALLSVGADMLREMAEDPGQTEVSCQFCDAVYRFAPEELREMLDRAGDEA